MSFKVQHKVQQECNRGRKAHEHWLEWDGNPQQARIH